MPKRGFLCLVAMLLALAPPVPAATTPDSLPKQVAFHISIKSPLELLGNLDNYVAAATKDTENEIPPGVLKLIAMTQVPIMAFAPGVDLDSEAHLVIPAPSKPPENIEEFMRYSMPGAVLVVRAPDLDALVERLEKLAWSLEKLEDGAGFADAYSLAAPQNMQLTLVRLDDDRVAVGMTVESIRRALESWTPTHNSDSLLTVHFSPANANMNLLGKARAHLEKMKEEHLAAMTRERIEPGVAGQWLNVSETIAILLVSEFESMRGAILALGFDEEGFRIDLKAKPNEASILSEVAGQIARIGAQDVSLAERLPAGAISLTLAAPIADMVPDSAKTRLKLLSELYGEEKLYAAIFAFVDSAASRTASGCYLDAETGKPYSLALYETADSQKIINAFTDGITKFNDALAATGSGLRQVEAGMLTEGGVSYYAGRFAFSDAHNLSKELERLHIALFISAIDGGVVVAMGNLTGAEFLDARAQIVSQDDGAGASFLASDQAKRILAALPFSQAALAFSDVGNLLEAFETLRAGDEGEDVKSAVNASLAELGKNRSLVGFGLGADAGWLVGRSVIPPDTVNQIIRRIEASEKRKKQPRFIPDPAARPDDYEDDLNEDADPDGKKEEEEVNEDGPAAA
ncbi:MAG: hypothetical protein LBS30_03410 [Planctomycetota bacterium]|jgi:hypothetical protein|nr:hypothetical protein [Planctomycetota bacterium]